MEKEHNPVVICSIARTPIGKLLGELKEFSGHELGTFAIKAAISRAQLAPSDIHEVMMGCVLPAGLGQAPARQAALLAGILNTTPCSTINKVCGSGMKCVMLAHDALLCGSSDIIIAGGMESMTNAPYLLLKARAGYRLGHSELYDHMVLDGLEDAYDKGRPMGFFAEQCAKEFNFSRKEQDDYAQSAFARARNAIETGQFADEIVPIIKKTKLGDKIIDQDEHPFSVKPERIPELQPAFIKDGTVTAGNSSAIADGAAALVLMKLRDAEKRGIKPIATIIGHSSAAKAASEFTTAPIDATRSLLEKIHWKMSDVDLVEINEAFAVVVLAFMKTLQVPRDKINIHGSGIALGHPIGATGARILVTLLASMQQNKLKRGIATLCIGGGEATAIAVELI